MNKSDIEKLKEKFFEETGINWENSQGEPDIDYVKWLESNCLQKQESDAVEFLIWTRNFPDTKSHSAYQLYELFKSQQLNNK